METANNETPVKEVISMNSLKQDKSGVLGIDWYEFLSLKKPKKSVNEVFPTDFSGPDCIVLRYAGADNGDVAICEEPVVLSVASGGSGSGDIDVRSDGGMEVPPNRGFDWYFRLGCDVFGAPTSYLPHLIHVYAPKNTNGKNKPEL